MSARVVVHEAAFDERVTGGAGARRRSACGFSGGVLAEVGDAVTCRSCRSRRAFEAKVAKALGARDARLLAAERERTAEMAAAVVWLADILERSLGAGANFAAVRARRARALTVLGKPARRRRP